MSALTTFIAKVRIKLCTRNYFHKHSLGCNIRLSSKYTREKHEKAEPYFIFSDPNSDKGESEDYDTFDPPVRRAFSNPDMATEVDDQGCSPAMFKDLHYDDEAPKASVKHGGGEENKRKKKGTKDGIERNGGVKLANGERKRTKPRKQLKFLLNRGRVKHKQRWRF